MKIEENVSLKELTSMYVGGRARWFTEVKSIEDLEGALEFAREKNLKVFILGGGSNILVSDNGFDGLVIHICITGIKNISNTNEFVEFEVGAGVLWDDFVKYTVENNLYGIENLSYIPGTVGASVVQNIGAYGQEVSQSMICVKAKHMSTLEDITFSNHDCNFSYRKSRFNRSEEDKGKYIITSVIFRLKKAGTLNTEYNDIQKYFKDNAPDLPSLRKAIINIRESKFPFPNAPTSGSVGSFWNADHIDEQTFENIISTLKNKGFYDKAMEMENKRNVFKVAQGYKIPYGIFIELLGFKGKTFGGVKILETHAGVINNYTGKATFDDVLNLSKQVTEAVFKEFGIRLNIEPEIVM